MVQKLEINAENLVSATHQMQLLPKDLERAVRYAQLQAGKYARSASRVSFRERTGIKNVARAKKRTKGSKGRAWLGGNPIPAKAVKGAVLIRGAKGKRKKIFVADEAGGPRTHHPDYFLLNVPGKPVYRRKKGQKGRGNLEIVYVDIQRQVQQAADDVIPGTKQVLQDAFIERAEKIIGEGNAAKKLASYKGSTEDRLSGLRYFRTTLR